MEERVTWHDRFLGELWWFEREDMWRGHGYVLLVRSRAQRTVTLQFSTERFRFGQVAPGGVRRVSAFSHVLTCDLDLETCVASEPEAVGLFELRDIAMMDAMVARYCELSAVRWSR